MECQVIDLSAGGAGLHHASEVPKPGLICELDIAGLGKFDGITMHIGASSLGVRFLFGEVERLSLFERLRDFVMMGVTSGAGETSPSRDANLRTSSGNVLSCEIDNISLREAILRSPVSPRIGELVSIGRAYGRVVRHEEAGFAVEFLQFHGA